MDQGSRIKEHVKLFLEETELKVDEEGIFQTRKTNPFTTRKLLFILQNFSKINIDEFKKKDLWKDLKEFENKRNIIVHHKEKNNFSNITLEKAQKMYDLTNNMITI